MGEKSESVVYPPGQQTTMPITPQGSSAQLKESAQIIISDLGAWLKEIVTKLYWQIITPYFYFIRRGPHRVFNLFIQSNHKYFIVFLNVGKANLHKNKNIGI